MQFKFDLKCIEPPSQGTIDLFSRIVRRSDSGAMVPLGNYLAAVTASRISGVHEIPGIVVITWGHGSDYTAFGSILDALKNVDNFGGDWNPEGFGIKLNEEQNLNWISAFPAGDLTEEIYNDLSPAVNAESIGEVLKIWREQIVEPSGIDDSLTFFVLGISHDEQSAQHIIDSVSVAIDEQFG